MRVCLLSTWKSLVRYTHLLTKNTFFQSKMIQKEKKNLQWSPFVSCIHRCIHRCIQVLVSFLAAEVNIEPSSESNNISATISFHQESGDAPLRIQGHITGLPSGHHGLHVHSNPDTSDQCMAAGPHFNPHNVSKLYSWPVKMHKMRKQGYFWVEKKGS